MNLNTWYTKKGFSTSMLDLPVRTSEDAHEIETLIKTAEQDGLSYQKVFISSTEIETKADTDTERHTAILTASTADVDRDNEIVVQSGINLKLYNKNPILAWGHDYSKPPIGKSLWTKVDGDRLKAKVKFADRPSDYPESVSWFPDDIFALAQQGIIKGVSIGFMPLEASSPTEKEITNNPSWVSAKRVIRKSTLLEISMVPIGANAHCLIENVQKGLTSKSVLERFGLQLPQESSWTWETIDCLPIEPIQEEPPRIEITKITRADILKSMLNK